MGIEGRILVISMRENSHNSKSLAKSQTATKNYCLDLEIIESVSIFELERNFFPFFQPVESMAHRKGCGFETSRIVNFLLCSTYASDQRRLSLAYFFLHLLLYSNVFFDAVPRDTKIGPESFKNRKHVRRTKGGSVQSHAHLLESCVVEQLQIQHSAI